MVGKSNRTFSKEFRQTRCGCTGKATRASAKSRGGWGSARALSTSGCGKVVKYRFMLAEKASFPVAFMCRMLKLARSVYYAWLQATPSERMLKERALVVHLHEVYRQSEATYGSPRLYRELCKQGFRIGRHRVARLMGVRVCGPAGTPALCAYDAGGRCCTCTEPPRPRLFHHRTQPGLGGRHYVCAHPRGLAFPRCRDGPFFPPHRGLGDQPAHRPPAGAEGSPPWRSSSASPPRASSTTRIAATHTLAPNIAPSSPLTASSLA